MTRMQCSFRLSVLCITVTCDSVYYIWQKWPSELQQGFRYLTLDMSSHWYINSYISYLYINVSSNGFCFCTFLWVEPLIGKSADSMYFDFSFDDCLSNRGWGFRIEGIKRTSWDCLMIHGCQLKNILSDISDACYVLVHHDMEGIHLNWQEQVYRGAVQLNINRAF